MESGGWKPISKCISHVTVCRKGIGNLNFIRIITDLENKYMDTKGERAGGMNWEIRIDIYTLLILCIK